MLVNQGIIKEWLNMENERYKTTARSSIFVLKGGNDAKGARNVIKLITLTPTYRLRDSPCENLNKRKKEKKN